MPAPNDAQCHTGGLSTSAGGLGGFSALCSSAATPGATVSFSGVAASFSGEVTPTSCCRGSAGTGSFGGSSATAAASAREFSSFRGLSSGTAAAAATAPFSTPAPARPAELESGVGGSTRLMCQRVINSGSPRYPCKVIVASNSTQSPGVSSEISLLRDSLNSSATSGRSRRGNRAGYMRTMSTLFVRTKKTSKPSRITRTSPCQVKVRRRYFSSKTMAELPRDRRDDFGPQSKRKSSHVSMEGAPLWTSGAAPLTWTKERIKYTATIVNTSPKKMITYFRAKTTAQFPTFRLQTSVRKVGKEMRDFRAMTFKHRGQ
mmetsp:Transcript_26348/g.61102  ORF Transcript_26348/g.61102 Transcript_26348/m.61102 type:complete len:317 (+) Transcript_26348:139-1089(+)